MRKCFFWISAFGYRAIILNKQHIVHWTRVTTDQGDHGDEDYQSQQQQQQPG